MTPAESVTVSVVSHGHDDWLPLLLRQLADTGAGRIAHVVVTHNLPPAAPLAEQGWPFQLTQRVNPRPAGFGANHNRAFEQAATPYFCVLNPDMEMADAGLWDALVDACASPGVGCAFPTLLNPDGTAQDNIRAAPTPAALFRRRLLRQGESRLDWASAAFWLLPSAVYRALGGFDERYFLYCEDVDFCLRLQLDGWTLRHVQQCRAVHHAQRSSLRRGRYFLWHVRSLLRLWSSPVLWRYLRRRPP